METIIKELLDHEGGICVSLISPTTYKSFEEKDRVRIMLKNGVRDVQKQLESRYDKIIYKPLLDTLHSLTNQVNLKHPPNSVGIFLTSGLAKLVELPFDVDYKTLVSDTFEIQDILYSLDKLTVYHVLLLSKKHTRLFKGIGNIVRELLNDDFPKCFEYPYEEDKPAYHALYTKDPSQVEEKRAEAFIREVHHTASTYVNGKPIILIGHDKHISRYKAAGKSAPILGEIHAMHDKIPVHELSKLVWPIIDNHQKSLEHTLLDTIASKLHRQEAVYGLQAVLDKLETLYDVHLVVERDFEVKGYLNREDGRLLCDPLDPLRYREVPNIVEHIIEKVLNRKHSKVNIVERDRLKDYDRIVLIRA